MTQRTRILLAVVVTAFIIVSIPAWIYMSYRPEITIRSANAARHHSQGRGYSRLSTSVGKRVFISYKNQFPAPGAVNYSLPEGPFDMFDPRLGYVVLWWDRAPGKTPEIMNGVTRSELQSLLTERAIFHNQMKAKWTYAAWFPWTKVEPDPRIPPITFNGVQDVSD